MAKTQKRAEKKAEGNKRSGGWGFDLRDLDRSIRPQDDFFQYASGGWIKRNKIPADQARWGSFDALREENLKKLKIIVEETDDQLVRDFYLSAMDEAGRERAGISPIREELKKIEKIKNTKDLITRIAHMHRRGFSPLWGVYVAQDEKKSDVNILYFHQSGLSLPDRDYYLKDDAESKRVRKEYVKHVRKIFELAQEKNKKRDLPDGREKDSRKNVAIVMKIETELARSSMTRVELRDVEKQYNKRTLGELAKEAKNVDWELYLRLVGAGRPKNFLVSQPEFLKKVGAMFESVSLPEWKVYLRWKVLNGTAGVLNKKFVRENFHFYATVLAGVKKMKPLWKRAVGAVDGNIGEALGKLYVEKYFKRIAKRKINALVDDLFIAYKKRIGGLDWMSAATKKKALMKLHAIKRKLGYPTRWKGYRGLVISRSHIMENLSHVNEFEWRRMVRKLHKRPDPTEWHMTPPTVNAYYSPNMNEIVFPAGIMQPPFFDPNADDALNYGTIGSIIGHEITHGFDDEGSKFDAKGNFKKWWGKTDRKLFEKKAKVIERQFNTYEPIAGMHVNGALTLGENIADLGGLVIAYQAFQKHLEKTIHQPAEREVLDGFTPEQRFFLGAGVMERDNMRLEYLKKILVVDTHSPSRYRVNGPLSNMPEFYEAFGVKKGDKLWREKKERARVW
ncbi:M13 family metallopeptidase [bacterium]|nr:M13 family metallopeptidase [bacterium]